MAASFDPSEHRRYKTRWFDDFVLGERFVIPSRTMTEALFLAFQAASGDNHPIHYDVEYCRRRGMPHMLAHGYQVNFLSWWKTAWLDFWISPRDSVILSSSVIHFTPHWK